MGYSTILLITNSEYGQANVALAVAYELAQHPNIQVHVASFPRLQKRVAKLQTLLPDASNFIGFHMITGPSYEEALSRTLSTPNFSRVLFHSPGCQGAIQSYKHTSVIMPWTVEEYYHQLLCIERIVEEVNPVGIVGDPLMPGAVDVCRKTKRSYLVLSPNSPKDLVGLSQPGLRGLWKYPACGSGFPFPVPLHLIPVNIYLIFWLVFYLVIDDRLKQVNAMRKEYGVTSPIMAFSDQYPYLFPAMTETEFPGLYIPPNITLTGPILLPSTPVENCDARLFQWLSNSGTKTVLINFGSHVMSNTDHIRQLADGIRVLLDCVPEAQVLWKLITDGETGNALEEVLGKHMEAGKVKVTEWLEAEPYAVLCHPNTACSVHHGGANSFFEAISAGVPQVIMPVWYDTYEFARRAECLGIGVWGSQSSAPSAEAQEFGAALVRVLGGSVDGEEMKRNAKLLSKLYQKKYGGNGRRNAAERILEVFGPASKPALIS
ncbi:udp-glucoronosyl and udp-glucosyl transferase family protein [Moniliophthora roreri MCA 2997]|uniref:Udp-glucoronosyl and udp-glucosyl transferase family protein n=1 Tax=Moniliophthora roreri (strain MCA 2997) TaxID=1381753 RepID=V2X1X8_MONRO|nr:udp-glucoronosyl and udp-glucosyl transferase family protein [Moniliophthora roreri MCA 2997]